MYIKNNIIFYTMPTQGRPRKYENDEERREHLKNYRKNWYAQNKDHFKEVVTTWENRKKTEDPNFKTNKERSREYYHTRVKPLRDKIRMMESIGVSFL